MMEKVHIAIILPYNEKHEILIQDRSNMKKKIKVKWGYFGGGIELGETAIAAVIRESKEELNANVKPEELEFIGTFFGYPSPNMKITLEVFLWKMNVTISELNLHEGKAMQLFACDKVSENMEHDITKRVAKKACEILNQKVSSF